MTVLLVAIGAAVGAPLRYLADRAVQSRHDSVFPWGTFAVNVSGSFILGALTEAVSVTAAPRGITALVGIGFCGALTTYSTFGFETVRLLQERAHLYASLNVVANVVAGIGAAYCGMALAQAIWG